MTERLSKPTQIIAVESFSTRQTMYNLDHQIELCSQLYDIPTEIVDAIVTVESNGDIYAYRTEPNYRYLVNVEKLTPFRKLTDKELNNEYAPNDFPCYSEISNRNTEWLGQQASWGPMQVMGAVAREYGFSGPFPMLCSEDSGIFYGVKHLSFLACRYLNKHNWTGVIAAYNAGSPRKDKTGAYINQSYVDKVLALLE